MKRLAIFTLLFISTFGLKAQNIPSAETILDAAYKQAASENKNVFVIFHASWCGWCKKMDASMNDAVIKKYFDENYVTVHLTVQETPQNKKLENPGAAAFLAKYKGESAGLPFFLILDKTGKLIGDSFGKDGNTGCPANKDEVDFFIALLKKSSKINDDGLELIKIRFRQNEAH
jgi:thioredoxin-related protein